MTIQTEPDYGEPSFTSSQEEYGIWDIRYFLVGERWGWIADTHSLPHLIEMRSGGSVHATYMSAKEHCMSVIESLTPDGFLPKSYVSTEDASREIHRLENGRWVCLLDGVIGEHDFATASLAAAAHEAESYGAEG